MKAKRGFIPYDGFKLLVAIVLLAIVALGLILPKGEVAAPAATPVEASEVAVVETEALPAPTETPEPAAEPAETESPAEDVQPTPEVELPPLPEPSEGIAYDPESGFILDADENHLYRLNDAGTGWTPIVPDALAAMQLSSSFGEYDWALVGDDYAAKYYWDGDTHSWVEISKEEATADEPAPIEAGATIAECLQASLPRLIPGGQAEVLTNVNFRSSPGVGNNWLATLLPGEKLNVVGETFCDDAYLWWLLERKDGDTGWTAEAPASGTNYFLAPVEAAP